MHSLLNLLRIDGLLDGLVYGRHESNTIIVGSQLLFVMNWKGGEELEWTDLSSQVTGSAWSASYQYNVQSSPQQSEHFPNLNSEKTVKPLRNS